MKKALSLLVGAVLITAVACNDTSKADQAKKDSISAAMKNDSMAKVMKDQHMKDSMDAAMKMAADTGSATKMDKKMDKMEKKMDKKMDKMDKKMDKMSK